MLDAGQDGRVADLEAVEVQDRQHGAVADRIEELVRLPCRGQRAGLRFAIADDTGDDQIGIVERCPKRMAQRVPQLATLMDRTRRLRRHVAGDPARERELREQPLEPGLILADVRIDLAVGAFEVGVGHQRRAAMSWTGDVDHVQVILCDDPVQVHVDEVLTRRRTPVPDHQGLHVLQLQPLLKQGIIVKIDLAYG